MNTLLSLILLPLDYPSVLLMLLFFILMISGVGLVILPEEVILLLGGYLAYLEFIPFSATVAVLTIGILAADMSGYWVGRRYGGWIEKHVVQRWRFAAVIFEKVITLFQKHGEKMVLFSRPLFIVRVAIPMFAGHTRMDFKKFLLYDAVVSIPWAVLLVSGSYYLSATLDVFAEARAIKHAVVIVLVLGFISYLAVRLIRSNIA